MKKRGDDDHKSMRVELSFEQAERIGENCKRVLKLLSESSPNPQEAYIVICRVSNWLKDTYEIEWSVPSESEISRRDKKWREEMQSRDRLIRGLGVLEKEWNLESLESLDLNHLD